MWYDWILKGVGKGEFKNDLVEGYGLKLKFYIMYVLIFGEDGEEFECFNCKFILLLYFCG